MQPAGGRPIEETAAAAASVAQVVKPVAAADPSRDEAAVGRLHAVKAWPGGLGRAPPPFAAASLRLLPSKELMIFRDVEVWWREDFTARTRCPIDPLPGVDAPLPGAWWPPAHL